MRDEGRVFGPLTNAAVGVMKYATRSSVEIRFDRFQDVVIWTGVGKALTRLSSSDAIVCVPPEAINTVKVAATPASAAACGVDHSDETDAG